MKAFRIFLLMIIIIGIVLIFTQKIWVPRLVDKILYYENSKNAEVSVGYIVFPEGNEKLIIGKTYTLEWLGGSDPTQIFLIDTSLKSAGVSVSIADRIYNVKNTGFYDYSVPKNIKEGTYEFQIGNQTSNTFKIASK